MNPAALRGQPAATSRAARTIIVDTHDFTARNLAKAGYAENPLEDDDSLGRVRRARGRPDRHDGRGGQGVRAVAQGRRPGEEHVRPRPAVVDVRPPDRVDDRRSWSAGSPRRPTSATPTSTAFKAGWNFGETTEAFAVQYEIKPAPMRAGHLPQHHRQPGAVLRPDRRRRCSPACRCSSAPTRSRRPRDILHELSKHKRFGVTTLPGRGRDRRHRRRARRVVRRRARRHHHLRARASRSSPRPSASA